VRATENYFTDRAVDEAFRGRYRALAPYEKPGANCWGKSDNWRVAQVMRKDELDSTDLGAFLSQL
jgi:hypothetical protein